MDMDMDMDTYIYIYVLCHINSSQLSGKVQTFQQRKKGNYK